MVSVIVTVLVVAVLCCLAVSVRVRRRSERLKRRFGVEYQAAVAQHQGDERSAQRALRQREHDLDAVEIRPVGAATAERLRGRLHELQEAFVDEPQTAVTRAVAEMDRLLADTGHPDDPRDLRTFLRFRGEDVLRDHNRARATVGSLGDGKASTEALRAAFVSARNVCEAIAGDGARTRSHNRSLPLAPRTTLTTTRRAS